MEHVDVQGLRIPVVGFGTWQLRGQECREGVAHALELGYRHIDTARMYRNETEVGAGLRDSGVDREDVLIVSKVPGRLGDRDGIRREVAGSLDDLGVDYLDVILLHQPGPHPIEETMAAFRDEQEAGRVRHLGVSNFGVDLLEQAHAEAPIVTVQNEYHPGRSQDDVLAWCRDHDVALTAYSPLGKGYETDNPALAEVGQRHGKSAAQVAIRWLIQQNHVITIPRSSNPQHRAENLDVFDFELSDTEMDEIAVGR